MSEKNIRWGIIGTGGVAQSFARGLHSLPDAELLAVGSRSLATAQSFAQALDAPRAYGSYEELVADKDLDIVYVATPHTRHKQDCLLALEAGKAVLCEKPFASSPAELREVMAAARAHRLFCMEAMWMRFMPLYDEVRALIAQNVIGEVRMLIADNGKAVRFDDQHRMFQPPAGSCLLDRGVYALALAQGLLGEPEHVAGQLSRNSRGVDEQVGLVLRYANGALAIMGSSLTAHTSNEVRIIGTHGSIHIHAPYYNPVKATIWTRPPKAPPGQGGTVRAWGARQRLMEKIKASQPGQWMLSLVEESDWPRRKGRRSVLFRPHTGNGYHYQAGEAMRCLRAGLLESPMMPLDASLRTLEIAESLLSGNLRPT
ncbi:Gfo/Idh/MocA family protein [Solimonas sp. K1W22B-7]|uniref:Gfo/Idh/MocA family protein n=1 Tax=Solimonas sp. K1W22B-7 TaxID=2303331 RepID=UPI0013C43C2F|nr:Gfo/Idh/MocA family oxidoreductase [Solimonas sp. K1W22B-7]